MCPPPRFSNVENQNVLKPPEMKKNHVFRHIFGKHVTKKYLAPSHMGKTNPAPSLGGEKITRPS